MKHVTWLRMFVVLFVFAALAALPSIALAQDDDDNVAPDVPIEGDPAMYPDIVDPGSEGQVQGAAVDLVLAQPPYTMNYQGYLTDNSGVPVDGTYNFEARLYDASTVGNQEWGPETHNNVAVKNGLFNLVLGSIVALNPNDFDEALFLQLTVAGTTLPRQPLRTTAYAFALVPGAEVDGAPPAGTNYALSVRNTSGAASSSGLYAEGPQYGLYAEESGTGDIGIYTPDYVRANGYRSAQDSYVFVPGQVAIPPDGYDSIFVAMDPETGGRVVARAIAPLPPGQERGIYLPIQVPAVLFGQNVTIESIVLYYELSDPNNTFISQVLLEERNVATDGSIVTRLNSTTDQKGSGLRSATYTPSNGALSSSTGPLSLRMLVKFQDTTDTFRLYGARLRLGHQ